MPTRFSIPKGVGLIALLGLAAAVSVALAARLRPPASEKLTPGTLVPRVTPLDSDGQRTLLVATTRNLDFGTLPRGTRHEQSFSVHNPGSAPIEVARITSSCDCLQVVLEKNVVDPGERVAAKAIVDFTHDPEFQGSLELEATAIATRTNAVAFTISVKLRVE